MRRLLLALPLVLLPLLLHGQEARQAPMAAAAAAHANSAAATGTPATIYGSNLKAWYDASDRGSIVKGGYLLSSGASFTHSTVPSVPFTVAFWARTTGAAGVALQVDDGTANSALVVDYSGSTSTRARSFVSGSATATTTLTGTTHSNVWTLTVVVFGSSAVDVYDILNTSGATSASGAYPSGLTTLRYGADASNSLTGRLGPLAIYNRALDATDRAKLFALEDPRSLAGGGPVDYYPMDGSAKTATAGGSDLTVVGSPTAEQNVIVWRDKSGNGNHVYAAKGLPVYQTGSINGLACVDFESSTVDCFKSTKGSGAVSAAPFAVYAVCQQESATTTQGIFAAGVDGSLNNYFWLYQATTSSAPTWRSRDGTTTSETAAGISRATGTPTMMQGREVSSSSRFCRAGTGWYSAEQTSSRVPSGIDSTFLGSTPALGNTYDGLIGEVFVVAVDPSDSQDADTVSYLDRWGLGLTPIPGWTPSDLGSGRLAAWYKPSGIQTTGEAVTSWSDSGPNGWHLTSVSSPAPQSVSWGVLNQKRAVQFVAANSTYLSRDVSSGLPDASSGVGIYTVACQTIESSAAAAVWIGDKDTTADHYTLVNTTGNDGIGFGARASSTTTTATSGTSDTTDKSKMGLWFGGAKSATDYVARLNDRVAVGRSTTSRNVSNMDRIALGANRSSTPSVPITAAISETVVLAGFPTDSEDAQIRAYLNTLYSYTTDGTNGRQWSPYTDLETPQNYIGLAMDAAVTSSVTASGGTVSAWTDALNRSSLTFTQGSGTLQPAESTINGIAAIDFDGSDDYMILSSAPFAADTSGYVLAVIQFDDDPGAANRFLFGSADDGLATNSLRIKVADSANVTSLPSVFQQNTDTADARRGAVNPATGRVSVIYVGSSGSGYLLGENGTTPTAGTSVSGSDTGHWFSSSSSLDNTTLGAYVDLLGPANYHNGRVGALFYVQRPAQAPLGPIGQLLRAWLGNRYGAF